ncbi:MAG TPA: hypothetical protein DC049_06625 [Spirochaetia bacterium]|nr:hypothetical protein [Spirochaetia bacterium]
MNGTTSDLSQNTSLLEIVYAHLAKKISDGFFADGKIPSEERLMRQFDVGRNTIRRAEKRLIREKIIVKIRGKGTFITGRISLNRVKTNISVFVKSSFFSGISSAWYTIYNAMLAACDFTRTSIRLMVLPEDARKRLEFITQEFASPDHHFIVIFGNAADMHTFFIEGRVSVPVLQVGAPSPCGFAGNLSVYYEAAGFIAVKYLHSLGHTRIAFVGGHRFGGAALKVQIICSYARTNNFSFPPEYIVYAGFNDQDKINQATAKLFQLPSPPTAIIAVNDQVAGMIYRALKYQNLRVPCDCSVIGFDNIIGMRKANPSLTTVDMKLEYIGARILKIAESAAAIKDFHLFNEIENPQLIIRNSCAAPQKKKTISVSGKKNKGA